MQKVSELQVLATSANSPVGDGYNEVVNQRDETVLYLFLAGGQLMYSTYEFFVAIQG